MASVDAAGTAPFVGRVHESERVRSVLESARHGRMAALLVSGDAGVGKTRLVDRICADAEHDGVLVLRGVCLPMAATTVPLMPLRTAVRRLPDGLAPPLLDDASPPPAGGVPVAVDDWLDRTSRDRGVVLVVDDVQWADEASLDVLTYVLAGPADRRLAVLLTLRRDEVSLGHPIRRWLADVRRMPCLAEMQLAPFDRIETGEQLKALLGASPHESLVTEVQVRTGGNAYLNRLLVEGLPAHTTALPPGLPEDFKGAVLRSWERLARPVRELVLAVAIGGEVAAGPALDRAVDLSGAVPQDVPGLLRDAVEGGVLDRIHGGGYWFHHPLQAEALESLLAPDERRRMHAGLARACEEGLEVEGGGLSAAQVAQVVAVAEHHSLAGEPDQAYAWTLRALEAAERTGDQQEASRLLQRAVDLNPRVRAPAESATELLVRLKDTAALLGQHEVEYRAVDALLATLDEVEQPLLVCELLVRHEHLRFATGRGFLRVEPMRRAVELSGRWPSSWQHGFALAEVAHTSLWADTPDAQAAVAAAVEAAEAIDHPRVTAYAFTAAAMGADFTEIPGGPALAARAVQGAAAARDWFGFVHASLWEGNTIASHGGLEWAEIVRARREQLTDLGAPHPYLAWMSVDEAGSFLLAGDWRATRDLLRVALGSDPGAMGDILSRLVAAHLAVVQGRQREAEDHLARADELCADTTAARAWQFDAVRTLVRTGAGDAQGAHAAAMTGLLSRGVPPTMCEWLCPLAARALADLAADSRQQGADPAEHLISLDELVERFPHVVPDGSTSNPKYRRQLDALDALYAAEVARARDDRDGATRWRRAAESLDGVLPWDAAYAAYRAGEAILLHHEGPRVDAANLLRRAATLATELAAAPVLSEVTALAATARIPLDPVEVAPEQDGSTLPGLTKREQEILSHIVAGRTYGEIARALFLSEKTVSSHVSNILRKTGTANRVDLARRAQHAAFRGTQP